MKQGYLLIDVLLAVTLSAVMLTSLYQCLYQTTTITRRVESTIEYGTMLALFGNQIEKDIACAFVPADKKGEPDTLRQAQGERGPRTEAGVSERGSGNNEKVSPKKEEQKESDEKLFFAEKNAQGFNSFFTCITTNRLKIYGQEVPTVGRIVYKLVPMKEKDLYKLTRQEATQQDLKLFDDAQSGKKSIKAYTIIDSLKKYTLKCIVLPEEEKEDDKKTTSPQAASFDVWNEEIQKKTKRKLPDFVEVSGIYWDAQQKREHEFMVRIHISARYPEEKKQTPKKEQQPGNLHVGNAPQQPAAVLQQPITGIA